MKEIIFTRKDYLEGGCTLHQYYEQFVTPYIKSLVKNQIGEDRIKNSQDQNFRDIPLTTWDNAIGPCPSDVAQKMRAAGDYPTLAGMVCLAKTAARIIKNE